MRLHHDLLDPRHSRFDLLSQYHVHHQVHDELHQTLWTLTSHVRHRSSCVRRATVPTMFVDLSLSSRGSPSYFATPSGAIDAFGYESMCVVVGSRALRLSFFCLEGRVAALSVALLVRSSIILRRRSRSTKSRSCCDETFEPRCCAAASSFVARSSTWNLDSMMLADMPQ